MKKTPGNALLPVDLPDERQVAAQLYGAKTDLYVNILDRVAKQPGLRFSDLRSVLGQRTNNVLTKALHKLQRSGILARHGFDAEASGYVLTEFGVLVRDAIVVHREVDRQYHQLPHDPGTTSATA